MLFKERDFPDCTRSRRRIEIFGAVQRVRLIRIAIAMNLMDVPVINVF